MSPLKDGKAYVQAGGGWVNDAEPEAEFQETVNKGKAIRPPSRCGTTARRVVKAVALAESFSKSP